VVLADDVALREIRLPAAFQGSLCLKGCDELRTLVLPSATLENLYLDGCHFLGPVPVKQVRRGVRMECQEGGTTCLPPGVRIGGSARLGFLRDGPVELPTGLRIGADLILDLAFASGVSLPPDAQVDGSLYLSNAYPGWNRTESIPAHLRVVAFGGYDELPSFPDWEG